MSTKTIKKSLRDSRYDLYKESLFKYGFLSLCYLIHHFEQTEDYEECGLIKSVIDDFNKELDVDCPTTWDEKAFKYFEDSRLELKVSKPIKPVEDRVIGQAKQILKQINKLQR